MIGDSSPDKLDEHIDKFGIFLLNKMRVSKEERESNIFALLHCVERLNHKSLIYASVAHVIAQENGDFGKLIVEKALEELNSFME